jgi:hypothetical protein
MGEYTWAVSGHRLGKYVPAETNAHATIKLLLEMGFFVGRCQDNWGNQVSSVQKSEEESL